MTASDQTVTEECVAYENALSEDWANWLWVTLCPHRKGGTRGRKMAHCKECLASAIRNAIALRRPSDTK